jgi:hypothetical protein
MVQVKVTISASGAVILDGARALMRGKEGGALSGSFFAPAGVPIEVGKGYQPRTDDGRAGNVLVTGRFDGEGGQQLTFIPLPGGW